PGVAGGGARLPPGGLRLERPGHRGPVEHGAVGERRAQRRKAGPVREDLAERDVLLAGGAELGPVPSDRCVEVDEAALDQPVRADGAERLADREEVDERLLPPRAAAPGVRPATPQVDHDPAADRDRDRRPYLAPPDAVGRQGVPDGGEPAIADALDGRWLRSEERRVGK